MSDVVHDPAALRAQVAVWRRAGARVALVPTMGALHRGHMALVEAARAMADRVVLSIFVNPTQFAPGEDFAAYPRTFDADRTLFEAAGGDCIYAPKPDAMYAPGFSTTVTPLGPACVGLEDAFRPTHFAGVATVVTKLLAQGAPDMAVFGEKDFQQLCVITRVAADLDLAVRICGVPTVREADGLALSSRNVFLTAGERAQAPELHRVLQTLARAATARSSIPAAEKQARDALLAAGFVIDYVVARDAATLLPPTPESTELRVLAAVRLGRTRLIDNLAVP